MLQRIRAATDDVELAEDDDQRLAALGLLIEPGEVAAPVLYACRLDLDDTGPARRSIGPR